MILVRNSERRSSRKSFGIGKIVSTVLGESRGENKELAYGCPGLSYWKRTSLVDGFNRKTLTAIIKGVRESALAARLIDPKVFDAGIRYLCRTSRM